MGLHLSDECPAAVYGQRWLRAARRRGADNSAVLFAIFAAGLFVYINCIFGFYTEFQTRLTPDSALFAQWSPWRTPGYPAFIHAVHSLTGDFRWLGVAQLNLLLLSFVALAWGMGHLARSRLAALTALLLLFGLKPLIASSMYLLNGTLLAALICFLMTGFCCYLRRPSSKAAACISGTVALIYLLRPAGLPFAATLPLLFIIPWLHSTSGKRPPAPAAAVRPKRLLAAIGLPILAVLLLMGSLNKLKHDSFSMQSYGGIFLFAHIAQLLQAEDGAGTRHAQLVRDLAADLAPMRERIAAASGPREYWNETKYRGSIMGETLMPRLASRSSGPRFAARLAEASGTAWELSAMVIGARPWRYAEHAAAHYLAVWRYAFLYRGQLADLPRYASQSYAGTERLLSPCLGGQHWFCGLDEFSASYGEGGYFLDPAIRARVEARAADATLIGRLWRLVVDNRAGVVGAVLALSLVSLALLPLAVMRGGGGVKTAHEN